MGERFLRTSSKSPTNGEVLRVKRVKVEGLFGLYNHDIPLNAKERVTIIHGPNGVGKTVLLKMIAAVFNGQYEDLVKVPYKKLLIEFSDGSLLSLTPGKFGDERDEREHIVTASIKMGGNTQENNILIDRIANKETPEPSYYALTLFGIRNQESVRGQLPVAGGTRRPDMHIPRWLPQLGDRVQVHIIETQRLLRANSFDSRDPNSPAFIPTVREYARELHARITEALAGYASESQILDQSFPQRLLKTTGHTGVMAFDVKARMTALNEKRAHLRKIGLLDSTTSSPFELESLDTLDHVQSNVMALYIEDTQQKLAVLDDIARRITLLLDNVNGKFRNKSIQISREEGFVVLGHDGAPIEPDSLSSGEQHELVQLYDLLFRVKPGTLVLVDEPELSLHVLWQKKYLSELLEISQTAEFDAIVATHSPFIVGDRNDLAVPLDADIDT